MTTYLRDLSIEDRIRLVEDIWDSIATDQEALPLTEAQKVELDRRLANHLANPDDVVPWSEVKAAVLAKIKSKKKLLTPDFCFLVSLSPEFPAPDFYPCILSPVS